MNGGCFATTRNTLNKYYPCTSVVGKYFETAEAEEKQTGHRSRRLLKLIPRTFIPEQIAGPTFTEKIRRSILFGLQWMERLLCIISSYNRTTSYRITNLLATIVRGYFLLLFLWCNTMVLEQNIVR